MNYGIQIAALSTTRARLASGDNEAKAADKEEGGQSEAGTGRHRDKQTDRRAEREINRQAQPF